MQRPRDGRREVFVAGRRAPPDGHLSRRTQAGWSRQMTTLETVACDLCGSTDARPSLCVRDRMYGLPGEFQLVQCQSCGLLYINPRPDKASIGAFYPDLDYHAFQPGRGLKAKLLRWLHRREA